MHPAIPRVWTWLRCLAEQGIGTAVATSRSEAEHLLGDTATRWVAIVDGDLPAYEGFQLCALLQDELGVPTLLLAPVEPGGPPFGLHG